MRTKHIDTLAQLRQAKNDLKLKIKATDKAMEDNIIYSLLDKLLGGKKKNKSSVDITTENNLRFLASQNEKSKFLMVGKSILSLAMALAVPILAQKAAKLLKNKL